MGFYSGVVYFQAVVIIIMFGVKWNRELPCRTIAFSKDVFHLIFIAIW